jgi:hypothetical protein
MPERTESPQESPEPETRARYRIRLPEFVSDDEIGLGDMVKRATNWIGITPCGGCTRRAERLNRAVTFRSRRSD